MLAGALRRLLNRYVRIPTAMKPPIRRHKCERGSLPIRNDRAGTALATILLVSLLSGLVTPSALASDRLNPDLLKSVLRIETAPDEHGSIEIGTGFLISTTGNESGKLLLITNKHMIGDWNYADQDIRNFRPWINVFFYRLGDPSGVSYRPKRIDILTDRRLLDTSKIYLHTGSSIDLVAIDVTQIAEDPSEHIQYEAFAKSYLLPFEYIQNVYTNIGDDVIALGYPLGIRSLQNDYPIAKVGYLASIPGQEVSIPFPCQNRAGISQSVTAKGKFLIVDGLIVPGNSGGPVVLVGGYRWGRNPQTNALGVSSEPVRNFVIGVVSATLGPSGLSVAVSSDYLLDLMRAGSSTTAPR